LPTPSEPSTTILASRVCDMFIGFRVLCFVFVGGGRREGEGGGLVVQYNKCVALWERCGGMGMMDAAHDLCVTLRGGFLP